MRGSPGLPTRRCRRIMLESASPIAFADTAGLYKCMPWTNLIQIGISSFDAHRIRKNSGYLAHLSAKPRFLEPSLPSSPENYLIG